MKIIRFLNNFIYRIYFNQVHCMYVKATSEHISNEKSKIEIKFMQKYQEKHYRFMQCHTFI